MSTRVIYLCDGNQCPAEIASCKRGGPCRHTSNVEHAINFKKFNETNDFYEVEAKRPRGECRTCKYYHPYIEKFSNDPRGDGYCVIARMTPEGMTTINCNDEFSCSDYQKIEGGGA